MTNGRAPEALALTHVGRREFLSEPALDRLRASDRAWIGLPDEKRGEEVAERGVLDSSGRDGSEWDRGGLQRCRGRRIELGVAARADADALIGLGVSWCSAKLRHGGRPGEIKIDDCLLGRGRSAIVAAGEDGLGWRRGEGLLVRAKATSRGGRRLMIARRRGRIGRCR